MKNIFILTTFCVLRAFGFSEADCGFSADEQQLIGPTTIFSETVLRKRPVMNLPEDVQVSNSKITLTLVNFYMDRAKIPSGGFQAFDFCLEQTSLSCLVELHAIEKSIFELTHSFERLRECAAAPTELKNQISSFWLPQLELLREDYISDSTTRLLRRSLKRSSEQFTLTKETLGLRFLNIFCPTIGTRSKFIRKQYLLESRLNGYKQDRIVEDTNRFDKEFDSLQQVCDSSLLK